MADERTNPTVRRPRVLVVDDCPDVRDSQALLLRLWGYDAATAADGAAALRAAEECPPDAILLDLHMPGMDGLDVARHLRQDLKFAGMVVALTGWGRDEDVRRALEAGCDRHLTKPCDPARLRGVLGGGSWSRADPSA